MQAPVECRGDDAVPGLVGNNPPTTSQAVLDLMGALASPPISPPFQPTFGLETSLLAPATVPAGETGDALVAAQLAMDPVMLDGVLDAGILTVTYTGLSADVHVDGPVTVGDVPFPAVDRVVNLGAQPTPPVMLDGPLTVQVVPTGEPGAVRYSLRNLRFGMSFHMASQGIDISLGLVCDDAPVGIGGTSLAGYTPPPCPLPNCVAPAPTNVTAIAGDDSATVQWSYPGGTPPGPVFVAVSSVTRDWCATDTSTCRISRLPAGVSQTFEVRACPRMPQWGTPSPAVVSAPVTPFAGHGGGFHPVAPFRLLDTRTGVGSSGGALGPDRSRPVRVTGVGSVPPSARAVVLNTTVTQGTAASYLSLTPASGAPLPPDAQSCWPLLNTATPKPTTASLVFGPGQTVSNLVTVGVGGDGSVSLFNQLGSVHAIGDVVGYYDDGVESSGSPFVGSTVPQRLLDSRTGVGGWSSQPLGQAQSRPVAVRGHAGVPATATAVVLNVTATNASLGSYVRVRPGSSASETASLLFGPGQTIANLVTTGIGDDGSIEFFNQRGSVDVVADVMGYFDPTAIGGGWFHPVTARVLDSRTGTGGWPGALGPAGSGTVAFASPAGATAIVGTLTATSPTAASYLSVVPAPLGAPPSTANVLFGPGQTIPNGVMVGLGSGAALSVFNQRGTSHVVLDVTGWFAPAS